MAAPTLPLTIEQRATFRKLFVWRNRRGRPIDMTGYEVKMQIRETHDSPVVLLELSSAPGGGITLTPAAGQMEIVITDEQTAAITWKKGVYDILLTTPGGQPGADRLRFLKGSVTVSPGVTQ